MRKRALPLLFVLFAGCRAVLGIEDPPDENGAAGTSSTTSPVGPDSAVTATTADGGGGPTTTTGGGDGGDSSATASFAVAVGAGGGGGEGGGATGPNPRVVDLQSTPLRLAYDLEGDEDGEAVYVLDDTGVFWRFSDQLEGARRCLQSDPWIAPDVDSPGWLTASGIEVSYSPDGSHTFPVSFPQGCAADAELCDCNAPEGDGLIAGRRVREGQFFGISSLTADLGHFSGNGFLLSVFAYAGKEYGDGRHLALGPILSYGSFTAEGFGGVLAYTAGGSSHPVITVAGGSIEALGAGTANEVYAWAHTAAVDQVVYAYDASDETPEVLDLVRLGPYSGQPAVVADGSYVYISTETGVVICQGQDICVVLSETGGRVADLAVTSQALYVLEGSKVLRYDDEYIDENFDTLPPYVFEER